MTGLTEKSPRFPSRRRFIAIGAAAAGVAALPGTSRARVPVATWRGIALGADASATLAGISQSQARPLFARMEAELGRLEGIFSLYRAQSALSRLNRLGRLRNPPPELLELLSLSDTIHAATEGAFDPTVQPLWSLYADAVMRNRMPRESEIRAARRRIGWQALRYDSDLVEFARPGMALTLNGIAQGYVTDRITELLRARGFGNILIDMGEIRASGTRPGGGPWRAGIADPDGGVLPLRIGLSDRALATSAPAATVLDSAGRIGHIFDPRPAATGTRWRQVTVSADRAALADGLATALCLLPRKAIARAIGSFATAKVEKLIS